MNKYSWSALVLTAAVVLCSSTLSHAQVYRLQGTGILHVDGQPFGVDGEEVTFDMQLGTHNLEFVPQGNPTLRVFHPSSTIPVSVVGSVSGAFANVDPLAVLAATNDDGGEDRLQIANGTPEMAAALFIALCPTGDCINSGNAPVTPTALLNLLKTTLTDDGSWSSDFGLFSTDNTANLYEVSGLAWNLSRISASASIPTTFDVRYVPGDAPMLVDGEDAVLVGGFAGDSDFPADGAGIVEFSLASLPADAVITSAMLNLDIQGFSGGNVELEIVAYEGDGVAMLDDATATGSTLLTGPLTFTGAGELALDVDFLQSLVGSGSHLGLRLSSTTPNLYLSFAALEDELASPVATLQLEYISDSIPLMGDFNNDGRVDAADYTVWRNTLGSTTELAADASGNGVVDAEDYELWKSHFGQPWGRGAPANAALIAGAQVPEPSTELLSLMGLSLALLYRRTSRELP